MNGKRNFIFAQMENLAIGSNPHLRKFAFRTLVLMVLCN